MAAAHDDATDTLGEAAALESGDLPRKERELRRAADGDRVVAALLVEHLCPAGGRRHATDAAKRAERVERETARRSAVEGRRRAAAGGLNTAQRRAAKRGDARRRTAEADAKTAARWANDEVALDDAGGRR